MIDDKGFEYSDDLTILKSCPETFRGDFVIPNTVIAIGDGAFYECSGLTSITIGNSVKTIGNYAFYDCDGLMSVTIPNSVTKIGDNAFDGCCKLKSVTIPNSVFEIGNNAFNECDEMTSIIIGSSLYLIGFAPFQNCRKLNSVSILSDAVVNLANEDSNYRFVELFGTQVNEYILGDQVTNIGRCVFEGCSNVKSLTIDKSIYKIEEGSFKDCNNLTKVTVNTTSISYVEHTRFRYVNYGDCCYSNCQFSKVFGEQVREYILGDAITEIKYGTFHNCKKLCCITIPASIIEIEPNAFKNCSNLASINVNPINTRFASVDGVLYNYSKDTLIRFPIGYKCPSYSIPNSVTTIGSYAFFECSGLTSITIPNSVTSIGSSAFDGCSGLTSITIPNSVTTIGDYAFSGCCGLTSVNMPISVTEIGDFAFQSCSGLTSITIPNSVTKIGNYAFYHVNNIVYNGTTNGSPWGAKCINGYIDDNLVYVDETKTILCGCSAATNGEFFIPDSVISIEKEAFSGCKNLTSITIPDSVIEIGNFAFKGCWRLTSVTIGDSVTKIEDWAFSGCSSLTSIEIPNSVIEIGDGAFKDCSNLVSVTIGNSVTKIGNYVFDGCCKLTSVTIPNSVTTIGDYAFSGCFSLTSVEIPNSVIEIGDGVFDDCENLVSIKVNPNNPIYDSREDCNAIIKTKENLLIADCGNSRIPLDVIRRGEDDFDKPNDGYYEDNANNDYYEEEHTFGRYRGSYAQDEAGYSDDDIDIIFDGNPDAYWNID